MVKFTLPKSNRTESVTRAGAVLLLVALAASFMYQLPRRAPFQPGLGLAADSRVDALLRSILTRDVRAVRCHLSRPLDLNTADSSGWTPLCHAASDKHPASVEIVRMLIERGADVNQRDGTGSTPLERAICCANDDAALALLRAGADPNLPGRSGTSPLMIAAGRLDGENVGGIL